MTTGKAAVAYATRLGWPVFPLAPRSKDPACAHGFHDATTDVEQVGRWFRQWPNANVGIACDERSGLLVIDVDPRHGGDEELAALEAGHGELPLTPLGLTGGNGYHYVFRRPQGVTFRGRLAPGIDVKANGYIVAPPSVHPNGREYAWDCGRHPLETPIADLPSWVLQRILSYELGQYGQPADDAAKSFLARAFAHAGWLGARIDAVRINCLCPWEGEHSTKSGSGGTVIFAPKAGGGGSGWFHCAHESHGRKSMRDVLAVLPVEACQKAAAEIAEEAAAEAGGDDYETEERLAIMSEDA